MSDKPCDWIRAFDANFNIGCVNETGERAHATFKEKDKGARWEFIYCPYCGGKINLLPQPPEDE